MDSPYYTMDPNAGFPAGYPVPTQSPSNQMPFYPNPMPQFPPTKTPSQQQHSFGAIPMQPGAPTGAMMPSGFPQSSAPMDSNFSAPFAQPPVAANMAQFSQPTPAPNVPSTVAQTFSQNMASLNANNLLANQQKAPSMNPSQAPPAPVTQAPSQPVSQSGTQPGTQPGTPAQSPAQAQAQAQMAAREKARVTALLDINSALLQEVINLQATGKAGSASNTDANPSDQTADPSKAGQKPSPEYMECMRRLQANLGYLATIADRAKKSGGVAPQAPAIMTPPPNLPSVNDLYGKLNELFPRAGKGSTPQKLSPGGSQGNGGPSPSPVSETVA